MFQWTARQQGASAHAATSRSMASGSGNDAESGSDAEHELSLDEHGRTAIRGTCDYRPRVWDGVVAEAAVPALVADCKAAYLKVTTQTAMTGITYSTNATYWVGADTAPRTALERFALSVFRFHSRRARFDPARSGAEWWTQVVSARDAEVGTIGFHWDRDYDLQYDQGLCEHVGRNQAGRKQVGARSEPGRSLGQPEARPGAERSLRSASWPEAEPACCILGTGVHPHPNPNPNPNTQASTRTSPR